MAHKDKEKTHLTIDRLESDSRFEFGILSKIVLTFVVLSFVPLGMMGLISLEGMDSIGDTSVERSTEALETEANNSLKQFAEDKSVQLDQSFFHYAQVINFSANYAEEVWQAPDNYTARDSFYHNNEIAGTPPGFQYSGDYNYNLSFDVSCYKLAPRAFGDRENDYYNITDNRTDNDADDPEDPTLYQGVSASINHSIETSSKLEDLLILQMKENPDISLIYFGTQDGVHRPYPWHTYSKSYDPIDRGWFKRAKAVKDVVVWSNPYVDASGQGLVLTPSRSVRDYSQDGAPMVGSVGLDITITTLKENILDFSIYNTGYTFLVNSKGEAIVHRDLEPADGASWTDKDLTVKITNETLEGAGFSQVMENMTTGRTGLETFTKDGKTYFVAYHPVNSTGFSLAVVADSEEVLKVVRETEQTISQKQDETMEYIFTLISVTTILVLLIGFFLARKIVKPLRHLTQTALEVSEGELDQTITILSRDEIGKLAKAFEKMVAALKKANIMIAREEHKGTDLTDTYSQTSVKEKARELLGVAVDTPARAPAAPAVMAAAPELTEAATPQPGSSFAPVPGYQSPEQQQAFAPRSLEAPVFEPSPGEVADNLFVGMKSPEPEPRPEPEAGPEHGNEPGPVSEFELSMEPKPGATPGLFGFRLENEEPEQKKEDSDEGIISLSDNDLFNALDQVKDGESKTRIQAPGERGKEEETEGD